MPCRDVDSGVGEVSSETMAEVELRPTSRARMIHPGREKLPRQSGRHDQPNAVYAVQDSFNLNFQGAN